MGFPNRSTRRAPDKAGRALRTAHRPHPTLWSLKAGDRCEILAYDQALADKYRIRLMEFGFHPGESVTCVQSLAFGAPKIYRVSNTIFSLDDEVATHVLVKLIDGDG